MFNDFYIKEIDDFRINRKIKKEDKILSAMSGGVDSSCAAALLKYNGFNVTGTTFKLFETPEVPLSIIDAKKVANILGIDHFVIDLIPEFNSYVIEPFVYKYLSGITPNPCIMCNKNIKFGKALDTAIKRGYNYICTGHYANVFFDEGKGRYLVRKSSSSKDQSYCFYTLSQAQLSHIILPLSGLEKSKVRSLSYNMSLPVHNKSESQDICFINSSYSDFIKNRKKDVKFDDLCGNFIDEKGNILGSHNGIYKFTIGQRKKLGISLGERTYIKEIDPKSNNIIVSKGEPIKKDFLIATDLNFIAFDKLDTKMKVMACTRYNSPEMPAWIIPIEDNKIKVEFEDKVKFIAPGQSVVFYDNDILIGGGLISNE